MPGRSHAVCIGRGGVVTAQRRRSTTAGWGRIFFRRSSARTAPFCVALTTAKTANPSIHMRLRAEHPRERLRTNPLGIFTVSVFRDWYERVGGFGLPLPIGTHNIWREILLDRLRISRAWWVGSTPVSGGSRPAGEIEDVFDATRPSVRAG